MDDSKLSIIQIRHTCPGNLTACPHCRPQGRRATLISEVIKLLITFGGQPSKFRFKLIMRHSVMKRMRVQSRQDFVRYAASPLVRPCTSDPYCNWRRFDSWNWVDLFDKRSRQVTHSSDGDSIQL